MPTSGHVLRRLVLSSSDAVALACAVMLSLACLARGAVYDNIVALMLLCSMPMLYIVAKTTRTAHQALQTLALLFFAAVALVLILQLLLPLAEVWHQAELATGQEMTAHAFYDYAEWMQGVGRTLLIMVMVVLALFVGASESSARIFLQGLLITGVICLAVTFLIKTSNGVPSSTHYSYRHGFVNPNNAATYLGIMFLLTIAQAARFFRLPSHTTFKNIITLMDQFDIGMIIKGMFLLFAMLLTLAGLLMTGSRGGIFISLVCGTLLLLAVVLKAGLPGKTRKWVMAGVLLVAAMTMAWVFINFGQVLINKLKTDGTSSNQRSDIFAATLPMIGDHPLLGVGLGSFPAAFQQYRPSTIPSDGIIDKAHNSYLEFAAEMGVPLFLLLMGMLAWIGWVLYNGLVERQERYVTPALGLAIWLLAALHSLVDFPLQIPGILALWVFMIVVCVSQTDRRFSDPAQTGAAPIRRRVRIRRRRSSN